MKGKWTEIYTRREKDIPGHLETSDGNDRGQGWACTCGCNKRVPFRKHSDGPPKEMCHNGVVVTSGEASEAYRENYDQIVWNGVHGK